jgi:hypothetical protein
MGQPDRPTQTEAGTRVRQRRVLYVPGFDPFPARRYREIYRREGAAQAALRGYDITIAPAKGRPFGWIVQTQTQGAQVTAEYRVLAWADIVRASMDPGIVATYALLARTFWIYFRSGVLWRLFRLRKGPVIAAFYPVVILLLQLGVAAGLAGFAAWAVGFLVPVWAAVPLGLGVMALALRGFRRLDGKLMAYYLLHDFAFTARDNGRNPPAMEARIGAFADHIREALASDADEVLVVGHSSGAHLAVSAVADALRNAPPAPDGPALALLTLGHAVPMQSFLPDAGRLRRDLRDVSADPRVTWVDVTAPGDGCCFALCDPVSVSGVAPSDKRGPLVISAAFSQSLAPETWARLKRRFFRLHFQYLCAFDGPTDYDYFQITGGARTLADRYRGRAPSVSRIETAVSPHTDTTP